MLSHRLLVVFGLLSVMCFFDCNLATPIAHAQQKAQFKIYRFDELFFERKMCFGWCPVYKVTVHSDGRALYEGEAWVKTKGTVTDDIPPAKVQELISALNEANFSSLHDSYAGKEDGCPEFWTCSPGVVITVKLNGESKTIRHDYGCREQRENGDYGEVYPNELYVLAKKIDQIVGTSRWVGTEDERISP